MKLSTFLFLSGVLGSGVLVACSDAGAPAGVAANAIERTCDTDVDAGPPPTPRPAPEVTVTANGTGCAGRQFVGSLSADEKTLTIAPQAEASADGGSTHAPPLFDNGVDVGQAFSIKDCTIGIEISNLGGRSYAVRALDMHGYAILDHAGMTAKQTAKFYFMGNPAPADELSNDLTGPYDAAIAWTETLGQEVWSSCDATRRLNAQLRSVVRNNADKTGAALLEIDPTFSVELDWRSCTP